MREPVYSAGRESAVSGLSDIHSHFLYGMDDGAQTQKDMEQMLLDAQKQGITELYATCHMTPGIRPFDTSAYFSRLQYAQSFCDSYHLGITVNCGAEILYTPALDEYVNQHSLIPLAGSEYVLMEFIPQITREEAEHAVTVMEHAGYLPILAHIERYACFKGSFPQKLKEHHHVGFQVNANSVIDAIGKSGGMPSAFLRRKRIRRWLHSDVIDFVASDAHGSHARPFRMKEAYFVLAKQFGEATAKKLCGRKETQPF